ncbi:PREDICTED: uncharacterized protein LOC108382220, partial [Rhagoletis zephyria]|uniref:uncharacterized protein LOC108382220 n=1 Tax=Rhagoletis zephyria TaxID=28612 RepID=UPI0008112D71
MYSSLSSLGSGSTIAQAMLIYIVIEKCDQQTRNKWNEALNLNSLPTWEQCSQVLERHCQFLQSSGTTLHLKSEPARLLSNAKQGQRLQSTFAISKAHCALCSNSEHKLAECSQFKGMSTTNRFDFIKKCGLCINCLGTGHRMAQCPSKHRCRSCSRSHHTLLHNERPPPSQQPSISNSSTTSSSSQPVAAITHSHSNLSQAGNVILATAMILVKDSSGTYKVGRALLDSCSQVNFISEEFAQKLRLHRDKQHVEIRSIGDSRTSINFCATTTIKSRLTSFELSLQFCITPHIAYQPDCEIDTSQWNLPANTPPADESFNKSRRVDLLLGTETFFDLLSVGQIKLGANIPTLQKTLLGWVVSGRYQNHQAALRNACMLLYNVSIDTNLKRLWTIDAVDTPSDPLQPEQRLCEEYYSKPTYQLPNGRLVVSLPFKQAADCLGNSIDIARRRFLGLERRLLQSPELRSQYIAFMQEYEDLGHMRRVTEPKPASVSTKLRVVFDASCRTSSQSSLNDLLLVGPSLQDDLFIQLLRFRQFRFALTADVTKMYRQVLIRPSERRYQYILWRTSPDDELQTYELNTVTYGTASAPYLAVRSLHYLADLYKEELPLGSSIVKSSFYVDDLLCGANDIESLRAIKAEVTEILRRGMFPLTKWHSNHPHIVEVQGCKELDIREDAVSSALGTTWNQESDMFLFTFTPKANSNK